ncbi:MAG: 16S rRNA (uracil(1498)-N(3))-methyltransferase [Desulfobacteraceae bacterium]|nr:16S rRNA (uracil(1498)-N(3))-methyltransferase [Desulfobacteraceae bacterium]
MRRFYNEKIDENTNFFSLSGKEAHHLKTVLRLKTGEEVIFTNGNGLDFLVKIKDLEKNYAEFSVIDIFKGKKDSHVKISLGFSMIKGKKNDEIIKPLTELGVFEIIPYISKRSISDPGEKKKTGKTERWAELAKEALKQCERSYLPRIRDVSQFEDVISNSDDYDLKIMFHERTTISSKTLMEKYMNPKKIIAIVGPEGGFTDEEKEAAINFGFETISLGPRILRAQTASLSAAFLCQHLFGDIH